jgi:DNA-binding MarR family transcriptional regulator
MNNQELHTKVIRGYREFGISQALFRNLIAERLGLNITDMECLDVLFFKGIASPKELSAYTGLTPGATTTMLDRLERSGLVRREPNPRDRRSVNICIVQEAAQKIGPLFAPLRQAQEELLSGYTAEELALLAEYFRRSTEMWEAGRDTLKQTLAK